jgi:predicted RNA binding protein YcfA (HicA-like mRNA interferase family)
VEPLSKGAGSQTSFQVFARWTPRDKAGEMTFSELVRKLEQGGFRKLREKGSIQYYGKSGYPRLIRVDYHGSKEVPKGTCYAILKAAGLKPK